MLIKLLIRAQCGTWRHEPPHGNLLHSAALPETPPRSCKESISESSRVYLKPSVRLQRYNPVRIQLNYDKAGTESPDLRTSIIANLTTATLTRTNFGTWEIQGRKPGIVELVARWTDGSELPGRDKSVGPTVE